MRFTKNKGMSLAVVSIIMAVFNVAAFVIPFAKSGGFWVGYIFATLAILLTAAVGLFALGREGIKSKFYGVPLVLVVWPYLIVQVIVSLLEMAIPAIPFKYEIVLNFVLLAVCLIGFISASMGKEEIERIDAAVKEKVFYIKSLQVDVETLAVKTQDEPFKKALMALAETIKYSDPMSSPKLASLENIIEGKVRMLSDNADSESSIAICDELQQLLAERNRKCKIMK